MSPQQYQLPEKSESLLTEILGLLQSLNATVESFQTKLEKIETELSASMTKIDTVIRDGFPDGDLLKHKRWHVKNIFTRLFN